MDGKRCLMQRRSLEVYTAIVPDVNASNVQRSWLHDQSLLSHRLSAMYSAPDTERNHERARECCGPSQIEHPGGRLKLQVLPFDGIPTDDRPATQAWLRPPRAIMTQTSLPPAPHAWPVVTATIEIITASKVPNPRVSAPS